MKKLSLALLILSASLHAQTTTNLNLALPAYGSANWNVPINGNSQIIDNVFSVGTCGDGSHALSYNSTTKTFGCQLLTSTVTGGTCTNQAVTAINTSGVPTCNTITSAYVNSSIPTNSTQIIALFSTCSGVQYLGADGACHNAGGGGTVTSVTFTGDGVVLSSTPSSAVTTSGTVAATLATAAAGTLLNNATSSSAAPTYTATPVLGVDNSVAGSVQTANGSSNAHTIWASAATTSNTIKGFATAPTTGHVVDCTTASTTCTLHDSGIVTANVVNASSPGVGIAHFAGSTQTVTSSAVSLTADVSATLPVANGGTGVTTQGPLLGNFLCGNHADGAGATWTCVSRRNVTSGDVLIAGCSGLLNDGGTAVTTVADTLSTSWTRIGTEYFESSPQTYHITAFKGTAASSGADTITCTSTNAATSFTGSVLVSVLNSTAVDVNPGGNSGTNGFGDSLALTTTAANDLCFQWQAGAVIVAAGTSSQIYNASNGVAFSVQKIPLTGTYIMTTMTSSNFGNISFCLK